MNLKLFESLQSVVTSDGQPAAVQMSIEAWRRLLDWLEAVEDRAAVKDPLPRLREGPQRSGALRWNDIESEWNAPAQ